MRRLHAFNSRLSSLRESGQASIMYIMMIIVICAGLGVGLDSAMGNYTSNSLRDSANTATMAASAETRYAAGNKREIDTAKAKARFASLYSQYRSAYPNVTSQGSGSVKYSFSRSRGSNVINTMTVDIKERSSTRFMALIGVKKFNHNISSTARLGALYETK